MVKVKFFGLLRLDLKTSEKLLEAGSVRELIGVLAKDIGQEPYNEKKLKEHVIFVNGKNIVDLKMFRTKLKDGDVVSFMSPVSGG